jgi:hypothetical protein
MNPKTDELGAEILELGPDQVMMEWEKPYMKALVDRLLPEGDVLEIGFGLGYSASFISKYPIKSYTVIESDPEVAKRASEWATNQPFPVKVVVGSWQDTINFLGEFDSIFFDDFAYGKYHDPLDIRIYDFFYKVLKSHAKIGTKLVWYCDSPIYWVSYPTTSWSNKPIYMEVPKNCKYRSSGNMYLPLVTFDGGKDPQATTIILDKFYTFRGAI